MQPALPNDTNAKSPWLLCILILGSIVWFVASRNDGQTVKSPQGARYSLREDDVGCRNIETVRAALTQKPKWAKKSDGSYYVAFADGYSFKEMNWTGWGAKEDDANCVYVGPKDTLSATTETEDLVCLKRNDIKSSGDCYWTPKTPPSERAGPQPN